jgi:hypothetical protein
VSVPTRVTTCSNPARWIAQLDAHSAREGECIVWTGSRSAHGYGCTRFDGKGGVRTSTHRASWLARVGDIPDDLEIDHLCRNPPCMRIDHLELVTRAENNRRKIRKPRPKTHCKHGHLLDAENTYLHPDGERRCITCRKARGKATYSPEKRAEQHRRAKLRRRERDGSAGG